MPQASDRVNLGCVNAGVDAYGADRTLIDICAKARGDGHPSDGRA